MSIPPASDEESQEPTFILASRLQPSSIIDKPASGSPGVEQIVILSTAGKACIRCNGIATFYSLPELSPAFGTTKVGSCRWIGGLDENQALEGQNEQVIMICTATRVMLVRIGEEARRVRNIEFPGCLRSSRRDTIACVADGRSYSLLEVEHQQKIPLFPISSSDGSEISQPGKTENLPQSSSPLPARNSSLAHRPLSPRGHDRSASLNFLRTDSGRPHPSRPVSTDLSGMIIPDLAPSGTGTPGAGSPPRGLNAPSPARTTSPDKGKSLPPPPRPPPSLKPYIISPTPSEFLLTTGTTETEAGVGMFVNLDGDVVRGTIQFESYPTALAIDRPGDGNPTLDDENENVYVVAVVKGLGDNEEFKLEVHDLQDLSNHPEVMSLGDLESGPAGITHALSTFDQSFSDVSEALRLIRLRLPGSQTPPESSGGAADPRTESSLQQVDREKALFELQSPSGEELNPGWAAQKLKDELDFAKRLAKGQSSMLFWQGNSIWTLAHNPLVTQLDTKLSQALQESADRSTKTVHPRLIIALLAQIRDREPRTEAEFVSLEYIRQKASLILFIHLLNDTQIKDREGELRLVESALVESNLDPRVVLLCLPFLREDVLQGFKGIWIHRGVAAITEKILNDVDSGDRSSDLELLGLIRRYLASWQGKRGFGSITDEKQVFDTVDSALLHTLLHLDQETSESSSASSSIRAKLNNVVDNWKGDFDRAVTLLERYGRLYVLSRLYQSRKLAKDVLATWQRIIEGERDTSRELSPEAAEVRIRKYLVNLRNAQLVEQYGLFLAQRNPALAIEVFTDDNSRVTFEPAELTTLLKDKAPNSVQQYLEYLVFNKGQTQYSDDLIGYYLDSMLSVLESSSDARESLSESYTTYRALSAPKPTYLTFITQNAPQDQIWWQSRLRLLQLLSGGSSYGSSSTTSQQLKYSIPTVLSRLAPFSKYLVSESIILDARQGHHSRAIDSLVHGLGDYDTAIRYCYFGGPSTPSTTIDSSLLPSPEVQKSLFNHLLAQFLQIAEPEDRVERTSDLLSHFPHYFDPLEILNSLPSDWSVDHLAEFFARTLRKLRSERDETMVVRGLAAAENLRKQVEWVEGCEKLGAMIEEVEGVLRNVRDHQHGKEQDSDGDDDGDENEHGRMGSSIDEVRSLLGGDDFIVS